MNSRTAHAGGIAVEFLLALPLLVSFVFVTLDIAQALRLRQESSVVSREAASAAFRDCLVNGLATPLPGAAESRGIPSGGAGSPEIPALLLEVKACLRKTSQQIEELSASNSSPFRLSLSVFHCDNFECSRACRADDGEEQGPDSCLQCRCLGAVTGLSEPESNLDVSKYWKDKQPFTEALAPIIDRRGVMVVSEVQVRYPSLSTTFLPERGYERTIF